jgi:sulfotransferase family protein
VSVASGARHTTPAASGVARGIVWLASYPKSGNTWFRVFYSNLINEGDGPADINALEKTPIASSTDLFEDVTGLEASELRPAEVERLRPDVYDHHVQLLDHVMYCKTHDAYTFTCTGRPLHSENATLGAIYFIRNPLDVAVSYAHHSNCALDVAIGWMGDPEHRMAGAGKTQLPQRLLTWSDHVVSWVDQSGIDPHVMRYEDMHADPMGTFTRAADYAGLPTEPDQVAKALEYSTFDVVKGQEQEAGFFEKAPGATNFFRKGRVGSWRESLTDAHAAQIIEDHRDVMLRFGYLTETGEPVF